MANALQFQVLIFWRSILGWVPHRVTLTINKYGNVLHQLSRKLSLSLDLKRNSLSFPMPPYESLMIVKENPNRKKRKVKSKISESSPYTRILGCRRPVYWYFDEVLIFIDQYLVIFLIFCGNFRNVKKENIDDKKLLVEHTLKRGDYVKSFKNKSLSVTLWLI